MAFQVDQGRHSSSTLSNPPSPSNPSETPLHPYHMNVQSSGKRNVLEKGKKRRAVELDSEEEQENIVPSKVHHSGNKGKNRGKSAQRVTRSSQRHR